MISQKGQFACIVCVIRHWGIFFFKKWHQTDGHRQLQPSISHNAKNTAFLRGPAKTHKWRLVSMVSKPNQPFLILLSDTNCAQNTLEIQARSINSNTHLSLYLDPTCNPKPLNTSHASQKWDDYYLTLICHFNIRQTSEWAAECNCPCLVRYIVGSPKEKETAGLLHLPHHETHSQNI